MRSWYSLSVAVPLHCIYLSVQLDLIEGHPSESEFSSLSCAVVKMLANCLNDDSCAFDSWLL
uniref:Bm9192, isoform b n=1 Tax=Brugia malayi TaxID=6279 RepID=A0A1I9G0X3_BRUMA|nr:Bm9192, isoform b [Brugia malayi]